MRLSKVTVPSKRRLSRYVVFPDRQAYFIYFDLHSSGIKIHAIQFAMPNTKLAVTPTVPKCAYNQWNLNTFPICSKSGANEVRIRIITCSYSSGQIQDQNRDSQLSLFLPFKWGLNSSDASSVSDVRDASNANKVSVPIFVSDASKAALVKLVKVSPVTSVRLLTSRCE